MQIDYHYLQAGWKVEEPIYFNKSAPPIINAGVILTPFHIDKLKKYAEQHPNEDCSAIVSFSEQNNLITDRVKPTVSKETQSKIVNSLQQFKKMDWTKTSQSVLANALSVVRESNQEIIRAVEKDPHLSYSLSDYKSKFLSQETFQHSLRVALFAVTLAYLYNQKYEENRLDLETIGMAALLHDYGSKFEDPMEYQKLCMLNPPTALFTQFPQAVDVIKDSMNKDSGYQEERTPLYTFLALKFSISSDKISSIATTILYSGEKEDGSGLLRLKHMDRTRSKVGARILYICNKYDNLLSETIQNNKSFEEIRGILGYEAENNIADKELVNLFFENIPLYSPGVLVELSTGENAIVEGRRIGELSDRPYVRTLVAPPQIPRTIDLGDVTKAQNITITKILGNEEIMNAKITQDMLNNIAMNQLENMDNLVIEQMQQEYPINDSETQTPKFRR